MPAAISTYSVVLALHIMAVIVAYGLPASRRMAELSRADVEATTGGSGITWGAEYERLYRRYMTAEITLGLSVLVAIFFMAAKPFA
jgi:hypothetical protein